MSVLPLCQSIEKACVNRIILNDKTTNGRVLIANYNNNIFVSFRGTKNLQNWCTNLQILFTDFNSVPAHSGFVYAYYRLKAEIFEAIVKIKSQYAYQHFNLFVSGHSLGGALASLFSMDYKLADAKDNLYLTTFGSFEFAEKLSDLVPNNLRVTQGRDTDPVTAVPFGLIGYCHVGLPLYIKMFCNFTNHKLSGYLDGINSLPSSTSLSISKPTFN